MLEISMHLEGPGGRVNSAYVSLVFLGSKENAESISEISKQE
jgi:hypothetical protein